MLGLFSPSKNHPLALEGTATILAPADLIFALVDFASPANRLAARGFAFSERARNVGKFAATDPTLPGVGFEFDVDLYDKDKAYGFFSRFVAEEPFGGFERSREEYHIASHDDGACRVTLKTRNWFRKGLNRRERRNEEILMSQALANDLAKLKIEAEALMKDDAA